MEKVNDIRTRIEEIIESDKKAYAEFIANNKALNERINERFITNQLTRQYLPDYLYEVYAQDLQKLVSGYQERAAEANRQLQKQIAIIKAKYINPLAISQKDKPDYDAKVNNAIQFIAAEERGITDSAARNILADFIYDYDTMRRFEKLIATQIGEQVVDHMGNTVFPETFGYMQKVGKVLEVFSEIEEISAVLFLREIKMFADMTNSVGNIHCKVGNPVRMVEDTQKILLVEIAGELELQITILNETKKDDYGRLPAESRFIHMDMIKNDARGYY